MMAGTWCAHNMLVVMACCDLAPLWSAGRLPTWMRASSVAACVQLCPFAARCAHMCVLVPVASCWCSRVVWECTYALFAPILRSHAVCSLVSVAVQLILWLGFELGSSQGSLVIASFRVPLIQMLVLVCCAGLLAPDSR